MNSSTRAWRVIPSYRSGHLIKCPIGSSCCATLLPGKEACKCARSRALIVTVRNASPLPRRFEHVYCAYSRHLHFVAANRVHLLSIYSQKLSSLTLIKSHLNVASEAYLKRDQKTVVKCVLGDVWSKVTTE